MASEAKGANTRVETIRAGLEGEFGLEKVVWIRAAERRLEELALRADWFGLEPFEADEARQLKALINVQPITTSSAA